MARHLHYPILNYQYAKLIALILLAVMLDNAVGFFDSVVSVENPTAWEKTHEYKMKHSRIYRKELRGVRESDMMFRQSAKGGVK